MKKTLLTLICLCAFSVVAIASNNETQFRCTADSIENCEKKVLAELENQQCEPLQNTIVCRESSSDKAIYCSANTNRCRDASSDGFSGITCREGVKVSIKDRKLSATWARSILWIWVRSMCKIG